MWYVFGVIGYAVGIGLGTYVAGMAWWQAHLFAVVLCWVGVAVGHLE